MSDPSASVSDMSESSAEREPAGQILRDYLYVDVDKVKSIAGQLESGVPEEARLTSRDAKRTVIGWKYVLSYNPESENENYVQRSMLDSLFPELEDALEQSWLDDVSDLFHSNRPEAFDELRERCPEGSLFRVTADGYLFDVRYLARLFSNVSAAFGGFQEFEREVKRLAEGATQGTNRPGNRPSGGRGGQSGKKSDRTPVGEHLEDSVEDFTDQPPLSPAFLKSMIRTARGVFSPGLHLLMSNDNVQSPLNISARLQDSMRYLDASPEVVAARFGVTAQRWTIVGTVGHYSMAPEQVGLASAMAQVENEISGDFNRSRFVRSVNSSINDMARSGMIELPQHPGMAAVPIAVYRAVRRTS